MVLLSSVSAEAKTITLVVEGKARMEDGSPVRVGTVLATVLKRQTGQMPKPRIAARAITDQSGTFRFSIEKLDGDLDIELVDDHCSWRGGFKLVRIEEMRGVRNLRVEIVAVTDPCVGGR